MMPTKATHKRGERIVAEKESYLCVTGLALSNPQTKDALARISRATDTAKRALTEERRQVEIFVEEQERKRALRGQ